MAKKPDLVIRKDDRVRVVNPVFVHRVGYPKSLREYEFEAKQKFGDRVKALLLDAGLRPYHPVTDRKEFKRMIHELAYAMAHADHFGGRERTLHTLERPELKDQIFFVESVVTKMTGRYYAPCSYGPDDYEPGGLENMKPHRLATLYIYDFSGGPKMIEVCNLEKVTDPH